MSALLAKLKKASTNKNTQVLSESTFFNKKGSCRTRIPILNIALSGELDGGLTSGLTFFAGPSKHFKSNMSLTLVSAYMQKYPEAVCLFYDSEFGITSSYLKSMGVDPSRVVHTPIMNVEQLKFDMMNQLEAIERGDKVIIFIDSIGNTASKKEVEDAINEKGAADMSRAKQLKSLFRMVTPYFTVKDIPCVAVNHSYETQEMFSKTVMSGGTGAMYSADTVFIIGRRQVKDGTEIAGYEFVLNVEKSRYVKEKSKLPVTVTFDGGINPFSGLLDIGLELGYVVKPKNGWYCKAFLNEETGEMEAEEKNVRAKDTNNATWWAPLIKHAAFREAVKNRYQLGAMVNDDSVDEEIQDLLNSETETYTSNHQGVEAIDQLEEFTVNTMSE